MVKILLAEDQRIVRQGLKMMIEQDPALQVVSEASNGLEAVEAFNSKIIDLVLMDIRMPVMTGLEATEKIRSQHPDALILILTTFADDEYAFEALRLGAVGYILKDADNDKLLHSIHSALRGGLSLDDQVAASVLPKLLEHNRGSSESHDLTERERSILALIGAGKNNQEIAAELFLSVGTVKNYVSQLLTKVEARDRTQLAIYAIRNHVV
ncbi:response regulator transcription factor [Alkalicoccobacillus porphyridii]|uniref:Response regulator transcription factor n=1 Tax=Alkalicoccobacillus porphyridii TaxID=2597270 RepID=A0A553ZV92_9BACI|nr:response regulator transcription factor [Alkalicoccobacillus porphyridii]TSB45255.1 response regulator transcription factor [Alkalicoccobacillus porphyridii]